MKPNVATVLRRLTKKKGFQPLRMNWGRFRRTIYCRLINNGDQLYLPGCRPDTVIITNIGQAIDAMLKVVIRGSLGEVPSKLVKPGQNALTIGCIIICGSPCPRIGIFLCVYGSHWWRFCLLKIKIAQFRFYLFVKEQRVHQMHPAWL